MAWVAGAGAAGERGPGREVTGGWVGMFTASEEAVCGQRIQSKKPRDSRLERREAEASGESEGLGSRGGPTGTPRKDMVVLAAAM